MKRTKKNILFSIGIYIMYNSFRYACIGYCKGKDNRDNNDLFGKRRKSHYIQQAVF